jgi:O-antigen/teichoic acid export membrane protein/2-polyprenyl-3-methyl-5-hydroxy-6-metoxy-1,4-benzoquinol methylase
VIEQANQTTKQSERGEMLPRAQGKFLTHVVALVVGNGVAQAINAAGSLGLAWIFAPAAYGMFAVFVAAVSFVAVVGGGRYELSIMLPDEDEEAANILTLSALILLAVSVLFAIVIAVFHERFNRLFDYPRGSGWLWIMPVALIVMGMYQILTFWASRMKRFTDVARSRVCQAVGILGGQLGLFFVYGGVGFALIGGWIFGQSLGVVFLLVQIVRKEGAFLIRAHNWGMIRAAVIKYKDFPLYKAPYSFVSNASTQCVPLILQMFSSLTVLGLYSMASRIVYLPVTLIASSMNQVFYEKAATELRFGRMEGFVTRILRIQTVLATPVLVLITVDAKVLFASFLGAKWAGAGLYAAILVWVAYLSFLTSWFDRLFDVKGRQRLSLILVTVGSSASLAGLFVVLWYTRNTALAVGAYAVLQVADIAIWLCMSYYVAEFKLKKLLLLVKDALFSAALAGGVIAVIHAEFSALHAVALSVVAVLILDGIFFARYVIGGHAFTSTEDRFRELWNAKLTSDADGGQSGIQPEELRRMVALHPKVRMLEIGCGEGAFFDSIGVAPSHYKGVDFCLKRVKAFRSQHPDIEVECVDGSSYVDSNLQYDVVLLNGVVQHFDADMVRTHLRSARAMMHEESVLVWSSVPNRAFRKLYDLGGRPEVTLAGTGRLCKSWLRRILGLDLMGYWYQPEEIARFAAEQGLVCKFVNSAVSSYRFHAILRRSGGTSRAGALSTELSEHDSYSKSPLSARNAT